MDAPNATTTHNEFQIRRLSQAIIRGDRKTAHAIVGKEHTEDIDWALLTIDTLSKLTHCLHKPRITALAAEIYGDPATSLEPNAKAGQVGSILSETVRILVAYGENSRVRAMAERVARTPWHDRRAQTVLAGRIEEVYGIASGARLRREYAPKNVSVQLDRFSIDELADERFGDEPARKPNNRARNENRDTYAVSELAKAAEEAADAGAGCKVKVHEEVEFGFLIEGVGMLARAAMKKRGDNGETGLEQIIEAAEIGLSETYRKARLRPVNTTGMPAITKDDAVRLDDTKMALAIQDPMLRSFIGNSARFGAITREQVVEIAVTAGLVRLNARRRTPQASSAD